MGRINKILELCKILETLEVDKIQLRQENDYYFYLSKYKPPDTVMRWKVNKYKLDNGWWRWEY